MLNIDAKQFFYVYIPNWEKYNPPTRYKTNRWFRMQVDLYQDPGVINCTLAARWLYICLLMSGGSSPNIIKLDYDSIETPLKLDKNSSETLLKLHQNSIETLLKLKLNSRQTRSKLHINGGKTLSKLFLELTDNNLVFLNLSPLPEKPLVIKSPLHNNTIHNNTKHNSTIKIKPRAKNDDTPPSESKKIIPKAEPSKVRRPLHSDWDLRISELILKKMKSINPNFRDKSVCLGKWAKNLRLLRQDILANDKNAKPEAVIEQALAWVYQNNFWAKTIQSTGGLRKNWDTITTQMNMPNQKKKSMLNQQQNLENYYESNSDTEEEEDKQSDY